MSSGRSSGTGRIGTTRCWLQYNGVLPGHRLAVWESPAYWSNSNSGVGILWVPASVLSDFGGGQVSLCGVGEDSDAAGVIIGPPVFVVVSSDSDQKWAVVTLVAAPATWSGVVPSGCVWWQGCRDLPKCM